MRFHVLQLNLKPQVDSGSCHNNMSSKHNGLQHLQAHAAEEGVAAAWRQTVVRRRRPQRRSVIVAGGFHQRLIVIRPARHCPPTSSADTLSAALQKSALSCSFFTGTGLQAGKSAIPAAQNRLGPREGMIVQGQLPQGDTCQVTSPFQDSSGLSVFSKRVGRRRKCEWLSTCPMMPRPRSRRRFRAHAAFWSSRNNRVDDDRVFMHGHLPQGATCQVAAPFQDLCCHSIFKKHLRKDRRL